MPLYSYQCKDCDHVFELLIKSEDRDNEHPCPKCGNIKIKRKMSAFASMSKSSSSTPPCYGSTPSCSGG